MKKKPTRVPVVFSDESFDYNLMRNLSYSIAQMADINECLTTAHRIQGSDFESWYDQWDATAQRIHSIAEQSLKEGHTVSAQSAFLRASNYYRTSEFYLHGNSNDPRIREAASKSRACFTQAIVLMPTSISEVQISYEETTLPGYFYKLDNKKRPTILLQTGFDGTQEELYLFAQEAIKRGYHVITFEGPGQGRVLREQGLPFRADWEVIIRAVVDFAIKQSEVDSNMLILYGLSLGGYFAPRGASGDDRIKILIANGGVYDYLGGISAIQGISKDAYVQEAKNNSAALDQTVKSVMKLNTAVRWAYEHGMFSFQAKTPSQLTLKYAEYTLKDRAHLIKCTTLICDSENEMPVFQGQAQQLYDHLQCPKTFMRFTSEEGAGFHCQLGALLLSTQRVFDWLDSTVAALKSGSK